MKFIPLYDILYVQLIEGGENTCEKIFLLYNMVYRSSCFDGDMRTFGYHKSDKYVNISTFGFTYIKLHCGGEFFTNAQNVRLSNNYNYAIIIFYNDVYARIFDEK